jgi:hypothetical protein
MQTQLPDPSVTGLRKTLEPQRIKDLRSLQEALNVYPQYSKATRYLQKLQEPPRPTECTPLTFLAAARHRLQEQPERPVLREPVPGLAAHRMHTVYRRAPCR